MALTSASARLDGQTTAGVIIAVPGFDPGGTLEVLAQELEVGSTNVGQGSAIAGGTGLSGRLDVEVCAER